MKNSNNYASQLNKSNRQLKSFFKFAGVIFIALAIASQYGLISIG